MSLSHFPASLKRSSDYLSVATQVGRNLAHKDMVFFKGGLGHPPDALELSGKKIQTSGKTEISWAVHLAKLRKVQAYAEKASRVLPNLSHRHYGAMVVLDNGIEALGTNIEASRKNTFCDLRYAITNALNRFIVKTERPSGSDAAAIKSPTVKTVYLANADLNAEPPVPCSDCQSWLDSRYVSPKTQVVSLEQNPSGKGARLRSRTVKDMLPLHKGRDEPVQLITDKRPQDLPVKVSLSANQLLNAQADLPDMARSLIRHAKQDTVKKDSACHDGKPQTGAAVLLSPAGLMNRQNTFSWSNRWTEPADLRAAANALERVDRRRQLTQKLPGFLQGFFAKWLAPQQVRAIAYYGELPPIPSLGRIARKSKSSETLVITVENDVIQVRTIQDYMPEMYQTRKA